MQQSVHSKHKACTKTVINNTGKTFWGTLLLFRSPGDSQPLPTTTTTRPANPSQLMRSQLRLEDSWKLPSHVLLWGETAQKHERGRQALESRLGLRELCRRAGTSTVWQCCSSLWRFSCLWSGHTEGLPRTSVHFQHRISLSLLQIQLRIYIKQIARDYTWPLSSRQTKTCSCSGSGTEVRQHAARCLLQRQTVCQQRKLQHGLFQWFSWKCSCLHCHIRYRVQVLKSILRLLY